MSTGGGNENEIVAGFDIVARLQLTMAQAMRQLAELERRPLTLAVDAQVTRGTGEQIQRAVDEAARKLQFAFSGTLKAGTDIRILEDSLRSMMAVSEQAGQKLQAVFTSGTKGGPSYLIKAQEDVAAVLESVQRHGSEFPADRMRLRVSGMARDAASFSGASAAFSGITEAAPDKELQREREANIEIAQQAAKAEADLARARLTTTAKELEERTKAQQGFGQGWDKGTAEEKKRLDKEFNVETEANLKEKLREQSESEKLTKAKAKEIEQSVKLAKWMDLWAGGGRPQRAFGEALQGPMSALLGAEGGALAAGAGAMIGGAMLFHIGWKITDALSKIPGEVAQHIAQNQIIDVMRARMAASPLGGLAAPERATTMSADKDVLAAMGVGESYFYRMSQDSKGGEEFKNTLNTLVRDWMGSVTDPKARAAMLHKLTGVAADAELAHVGAGMGNPLEIANALVGLEQENDPAALETILKQPGMRQFMVRRKREEDLKQGGTGFKPLSDVRVFAGIEDRLKAEIASGSPSLREHAAKTVKDAFDNVVGSNQNVAAMREKGGQWQPGKDIVEAINRVFGTKEKLNLDDKSSLGMYEKLREQEHMTHDEAMKTYRLWYEGKAPHPISGSYRQGGRTAATPQRLGQLTEAIETSLGAFNPALGGALPDYKSPVMGQPQFSFSSLSGFADKMQTEAGIHIDYAQQTATGMQQANQHLEQIARNTGGGKEDVMGSPAMGQNINMPATYTGN